MSRRQLFKQADLLKGATAGGMKVGRVEIDTSGKIVLVSGEPARPEPASDYDTWRAKRDARSA